MAQGITCSCNFVLIFAADIPYPGVHIQRDPNPELPQTVTALTTENGSKIYIVGTAHFSESSQDDVSKVRQGHFRYKILKVHIANV